MFDNRIHLINHITSLHLFDGKYENIQCVNCNAKTGEQKNGAFSVVFKAHDKLNDKNVAIKFYDPDADPFNTYRVKSFNREVDILKTIIHRSRALKLPQDLKTYNLSVKDPNTGNLINLKCLYFVVDWINDEIDHYFEKQHIYSAKEKLILFDNIVLALRQLHDLEIAHRDIKQDNLREQVTKIKNLIIAIDLGCAARMDMVNLNPNYTQNVGAPGYSSPESLSGLSGVRSLGIHTDVYAIGCLIFELFNIDFYYDVIRKDRNYMAGIGTMVMFCPTINPLSKREAEFYSLTNSFRALMKPPTIEQPGNTIPKSIKNELNELFIKLVQPDPRSRLHEDLLWLSNRIKILIKILNNQLYENYKAQKRDKMKKIRLRKAKIKLIKNIPTSIQLQVI